MLTVSKRCFSPQLFRLRVSGLPYQIGGLLKDFKQYGALSEERVVSETGKDLGQALISFASVEEAIKAQQELNGTFFCLPEPYAPRRLCVTNDFRGPRIVKEVFLSPKPNKRQLIKQVREKAVGAKWPTEPVMASTNESRMLRRYKTGGLPRSHDRQR